MIVTVTMIIIHLIISNHYDDQGALAIIMMIDDLDDQGVDRKLIINMFADASQCPKLHMKPKIFIFQVKYKLCSAIKFHKYKRIDT